MSKKKEKSAELSSGRVRGLNGAKSESRAQSQAVSTTFSVLMSPWQIPHSCDCASACPSPARVNLDRCLFSAGRERLFAHLEQLEGEPLALDVVEEGALREAVEEVGVDVLPQQVAPALRLHHPRERRHVAALRPDIPNDAARSAAAVPIHGPLSSREETRVGTKRGRVGAYQLRLNLSRISSSSFCTSAKDTASRLV